MAQEGVEEVELTEPWKAVRQAGATPELIAPESGEVQAFQHLDKSSTFTVDTTLDEADPADYDGVVLPGGVANPDQLRTETKAVEFLQRFFAEGKPVGVICHGPWSARVGRRDGPGASAGHHANRQKSLKKDV